MLTAQRMRELEHAPAFAATAEERDFVVSMLEARCEELGWQILREIAAQELFRRANTVRPPAFGLRSAGRYELEADAYEGAAE